MHPSRALSSLALVLVCIVGCGRDLSPATHTQRPSSSGPAASTRKPAQDQRPLQNRRFRYQGKTAEQWKEAYVDLDPDYQKQAIHALTAIRRATERTGISRFLRDAVLDEKNNRSVRIAAFEGIDMQSADAVIASLPVADFCDYRNFGVATSVFLNNRESWPHPDCVAAFRQAQEEPGRFSQILAAVALVSLGDAEFREGLRGADAWLSAYPTDIAPEWLMRTKFMSSQDTRDRLVRVVARRDAQFYRPALAMLLALPQNQEGVDTLRAVIPQLRQSLQSEDELTKGFAASALGMARDDAPETLSRLIELLKDEHVEVRIGAARALGCIGTAAEDAVPELGRLLGDENYRVRAAAARSLGSFGPAASEFLGNLRAALAKESFDSQDPHTGLPTNAVHEILFAIGKITAPSSGNTGSHGVEG